MNIIKQGIQIELDAHDLLGVVVGIVEDNMTVEEIIKEETGLGCIYSLEIIHPIEWKKGKIQLKVILVDGRV